MKRFLLLGLLVLAGCDGLTNEQKIKGVQGCMAAGLEADVRYAQVTCFVPWRKK